MCAIPLLHIVATRGIKTKLSLQVLLRFEIRINFSRQPLWIYFATVLKCAYIFF